MDILLEKINEMRKKWLGNQRVSTTYIPSIHDKIKFNINYYLSQVAKHFKFKTALVLDSDDLGTSLILKATGFNVKNIHIPNYLNDETEYTVMKERMPNISVFPISVDNYVDAYINSRGAITFRDKLVEAYNKTKYITKPRLKTPYPPRPKQFDFIVMIYV